MSLKQLGGPMRKIGIAVAARASFELVVSSSVSR
jgi:hypothetical protein